MISAIWKPFGITIETDDVAAATIGGITNYSVGESLQLDRTSVDGSPYPVFTSMQGRDESIKATTFNIDDLIDVVGVSGQCIKGDNTLDGIQLWIAKYDQCTHRPVSGSVHRNFGINFVGVTTTTRGIISLESISCDHRGDATGALMIDPTVDAASTDTFAIEEGVDLAIPTIADNRHRYTLGKTTVGGVLIEGRTSFQLTSGINVSKISADSNVAAEFVYISEAKPVIAIRGIDPTWAVPRSGLLCTHANTIIYLRRRGETSGVDFEDDAETKHIKFTVKGRAFKEQLAGGSSNAPAETALVIYPEYDPDTLMVPIVASTGQAIT